MTLDPWILAFSAATVIATIWMGFWSAKRSRTAHDFFVAGRSVSVGWNASAISGEYLSAASFMGVAGMVMSSGYDALWYPVCYACGYLFLLLFIAGPLRRFGAYTIPDFAEGRFDSPLFRKIAVVFVLFIGFFYTMPQMKGAGTTLAYIFPGLPYWAGVVLVGAVITLNVALGGMKGITLVQAFQYWLKMFAISVPIFVLMAVYGHYGGQIGVNGGDRLGGYTDRSQLTREIRRVRSFDGFDEVHGDFAFNRFSVTNIAIRNGWQNLVRSLHYQAKLLAGAKLNDYSRTNGTLGQLLGAIASYSGRIVLVDSDIRIESTNVTFDTTKARTRGEALRILHETVRTAGFAIFTLNERESVCVDRATFDLLARGSTESALAVALTELPAIIAKRTVFAEFSPDPGSQPLLEHGSRIASHHLTRGRLDGWVQGYANLLGKRVLVPAQLANMELSLTSTNFVGSRDAHAGFLEAELKRNGLAALSFNVPHELVVAARDAEDLKQFVGDHALGARFQLEAAGSARFLLTLPTGASQRQPLPDKAPADATWLNPFGPLTTKAAKAAAANARSAEFLADHQESSIRSERRYALLYTYSLIIALVCGTAGLPHILVRFYTNPDGVAAKRTTMWVMILIGVFYLFPPVFGVMGRNLLPELYAATGAKGTDKVVLELPRILNEHGGKGEREKGRIPSAPFPPSPLSLEPAASASKFSWGSILSGITCAGAFAAFMSTFSGLLVSMTGALAHDVYGRIFRPNSTPQQRMRAFRYCAVIIGAVAILLGMQVEPFQINFMVGQAFAIAAASYFPLLFVSCWWRGLTMKGAAAGMLAGGLCAIGAISLTSFSDLALAGGQTAKIFAVFAPLDEFWKAHPLWRILCEQPALWAVPLAIGLMILVSKFTQRDVPPDIRMKMLVLHAPEKLGLKQEYIQDHQQGH